MKRALIAVAVVAALVAIFWMIRGPARRSARLLGPELAAGIRRDSSRTIKRGSG
jgi:hypothetical protein